MADPNTRDTQFQAFNAGSFRFIIAIGDVAKHIRRIRTLYRYLPKLPGDVVTTGAQICHSVMNSFPKRWQQSVMYGGAERYHTATLDTIQQHMMFEKATEDSAVKAKGGKKKYALARKRKKEDATDEDSDCRGTIQAIRITITIVIITMKAITKTTVAVEEAEAEAEAEEEIAETVDIRANALIQIITTNRTTTITIRFLMRRTRIRIITNSNYQLLLRISNNNRRSNSSSKIRIVTSATTGVTTTTMVVTNKIFVGETKQKYMSVPHQAMRN